MTTNATSVGDGFNEELSSEGPSLSGTDAVVTSSRWIEGWRGCEQQVVSLAATNGSLSGTFRLRFGDQATVPLDANASAEAVEVRLRQFGVMLRFSIQKFADAGSLETCRRLL